MYGVNSKCLNHMDQDCESCVCMFLLRKYKKNGGGAGCSAGHGLQLGVGGCAVVSLQSW